MGMGEGGGLEIKGMAQGGGRKLSLIGSLYVRMASFSVVLEWSCWVCS